MSGKQPADEPAPHSAHRCGGDENLHWYALKIHYGRSAPIIAELAKDGIEYFAPTDVLPSLLFVHCDGKRVMLLGEEYRQQAWVYRSLDDRRQPAAIPDREMAVFRFVVTAGRQGLTLLGDDRPEYHEGDRVVVTGGPFKGAEGHIKRIKRDRRLVVSIKGVVAVATTYIHPSLLRKADEAEQQSKAIGWGRV